MLLLVGFVTATTNDAGRYYSFDDADLSGSNPDDISGYGNDGTNNGATTGATGHINEGFDLDGSSDWVTGSQITNLSVSHDFTVGFWFKADSIAIETAIDAESPSTPLSAVCRN